MRWILISKNAIFSDDSNPGEIIWTTDPMTHNFTSNDPLKCKVTYSVPSQGGFTQEYVYEHSTKYFIRELTATPAMQYSLVGSNDATFTCTAKGDVASLQWTVEGRTDVNENGVSVNLLTNSSFERVSELTVTNTLKDEVFTCNVTYTLGGSEVEYTNFYSLGAIHTDMCFKFIKLLSNNEPQ